MHGVTAKNCSFHICKRGDASPQTHPALRMRGGLRLGLPGNELGSSAVVFQEFHLRFLTSGMLMAVDLTPCVLSFHTCQQSILVTQPALTDLQRGAAELPGRQPGGEARFPEVPDGGHHQRHAVAH